MCYGKKGSERRQISCGTWEEQQGRTNTSFKWPPLAANEIVEHPSMKRYRASGATECVPGEPRCHHNVTRPHNITGSMKEKLCCCFCGLPWKSSAGIFENASWNIDGLASFTAHVYIFSTFEFLRVSSRASAIVTPAGAIAALPLCPPAFSRVWKGARLVCGFPEFRWFLSPVGGCRQMSGPAISHLRVFRPPAVAFRTHSPVSAVDPCRALTSACLLYLLSGFLISFAVFIQFCAKIEPKYEYPQMNW